VKNNIDVIAASSAAVYEDSNEILSESSPSKPASPYGQSKLIMEQLLTDASISSKINCLSLRMFNVYGKCQNIEYAGVITKFLENIKNETDLSHYRLVVDTPEDLKHFEKIIDLMDLH
jgi:UDP-glucose 4-epimerase